MHTSPDNFWNWLSKFDGEDVAGIIAIVSVFSVAAVIAICFTIYKIHKSRSEDALKRELLDRCLSADEIATIVSSKPSRFAAPSGDQ